MVVNSEKNKPLVSFVVNCYNGEKYLNKCLSSILNQTYKNWELIFWDNASTDKSEEIFNTYKDYRFKYFKSEVNVTLGQARAWAVDNCVGEYIAFLDVDDEWFPEKTKVQIEEMLKDDFVLSYSGFLEVNDKTGSVNKVLPAYTSGYLFSENLIQFEINMPSSMVKKSSLLAKKLNFDKKIKASEEYCLYMQLIYKEKVCVINKPLAKYLLREDSLTNQCIKHWGEERKFTLNKIIDKDPDALINFTKEFKKAFARAEYYNLRFNLEVNNIKSAKISVIKIYKLDFRYFIITFLLFISPSILRFFFKKYYNR
jgi:glycosyltransferase involved in cell wall biosynthesis